MPYDRHWRESICKAAAAVLTALALTFPQSAASALPETIQRVKPSIVAIGTFERTRSPAFNMRGTGFVLGDGNVVATNVHVVPEFLPASGGEILVARIPAENGELRQRVATLIAVDKSHDLALLKLEGAPLPPIFLSMETVREGQEAAFIGFPIGDVLGLTPVTHRAIISAIAPIAIPGATARQLTEKVVRRLKSGSFVIYQLDGTAYPGNSGGPLLNVETGEVIGIINMVFVKGSKESMLSQPSGISFAIPVLHLRELLRQKGL
ncbi:MAG: serine protease [Candidatus Accumulibacter sp.]|jgi:S1-C subfamily serine protease|nr:serine protease [Accumulibacter sp.]